MADERCVACRGRRPIRSKSERDRSARHTRHRGRTGAAYPLRLGRAAGLSTYLTSRQEILSAVSLFIAVVEADKNGFDGTTVEADHNADPSAGDADAIVKRWELSGGL